MGSMAMAAGLDIVREGKDSIPRPPSVKTSNKRGPSVEEPDAIELNDCGNLSRKHGEARPSSPSELENSQPPTPRQSDSTGLVPSWSYPKMNKWRILSACLVYFGNGMNDSAPGALIPYMETYFSIGYAVVSLIWVANAAGFITTAFLTDPVSFRLGRARSLMASEACMITAYVMIACSPPFPVVVVAYFFSGLGNALNLALNNVFCANMNKPTVILGLAHGSYGIGGICGPIIATALASNGVLWSRFFLIMIGIRSVAFFCTGFTFWNYEKEGVNHFVNSLQNVASRQGAVEQAEPSKMRLLGRALRSRVTISGAIFIFAYQGAEVSISGWFISYLINYRGGDPAKVGYVTAGFWAGITLGRFTLTHAAPYVGEKPFVYALGIGSIAFQLLAWFVPNVIGASGKTFSAPHPYLSNNVNDRQSLRLRPRTAIGSSVPLCSDHLRQIFNTQHSNDLDQFHIERRVQWRSSSAFYDRSSGFSRGDVCSPSDLYRLLRSDAELLVHDAETSEKERVMSSRCLGTKKSGWPRCDGGCCSV